MKITEFSDSETLDKITKGEKRKRSDSPSPNVLPKKFDLNHAAFSDSDDEETDSDDAIDIYRRYNPVENFDYESPVQFEDENVSSNGSREDQKGDEVEAEDGCIYARMLPQITGLPLHAFQGRKRKNVVMTEVYPVSAYNPSGNVLDGKGGISIQDPLHGKCGFSNIRKSMHQMVKSMSTQAPLRKADWENLERNEEAATLSLRLSTGGPIASESQIAPLVSDKRVVKAHQEEDGARLLELNRQPKVKKPRYPGKGRRKVEIRRLEDRAKRAVTFCKRRAGLFSKMEELCTRCGVKAAIITFTEAQNAYVFGYPTVQPVIERYEAETSATNTASNVCDNSEHVTELDGKYAAALARLEAEKKRGLILDKALAVVGGEAPTEALGSDEVELIRAMLEEMVEKPSSPGSQASTTKKPSSL